MGYLGRRIGKSQDTGNSDPASRTDVGGGILDLFAAGYFERQGKSYNNPGLPPDPDPITATGGTIGEYIENGCLLYTSPSPRDISGSRMPSSA